MPTSGCLGGRFFLDMIVYKYKSLGDSKCTLEQEKQIGFLKDIYENNRLYASDFNILDDPMEGIFKSYSGEESEIVQKIKDGKSSIYICSLSPTYRCMLMWSFYANCHKGCCVEVEISDDLIQNVIYDNNPIRIDSPNISEEEKVKQILSRKYKEWDFEKELRVLYKERYVPVSVRKIYFGMRVSNDLFKKMKDEIHTQNKNIKVLKMRVNMFKHKDTKN